MSLNVSEYFFVTDRILDHSGTLVPIKNNGDMQYSGLQTDDGYWPMEDQFEGVGVVESVPFYDSQSVDRSIINGNVNVDNNLIIGDAIDLNKTTAVENVTVKNNNNEVTHDERDLTAVITTILESDILDVSILDIWNKVDQDVLIASTTMRNNRKHVLIRNEEEENINEDGNKTKYDDLILEGVQAESHEEWLSIVDKQYVHRGYQEIPVVAVRFTKNSSPRDEDYIKYSPKILEVFLNHDSEDCPNGGGFYDQSDFEKAIGADLFKTALDNKYMSVKNIFAAESHGQFRPHFTVLDEVIEIEYDIEECINNPRHVCSDLIIRDLYSTFTDKFTDSLGDVAPNGNKWHTDMEGSRTLVIFHIGGFETNKLSDYTYSARGTFLRPQDNRIVSFDKYLLTSLYFDECKFSSSECSNIITPPSTTVHELGHLLLSLTDLYDNSYKSAGIGYYDTMGWSFGSQGNETCKEHIKSEHNNGQRPPMLSAITRLWIGWSWPVTLYEKETHVLKDVYADAVDENACLAKEYTVQPTLIHNDPYTGFADDELYAIEYRTATILEPCLPGDGGILIYHADQGRPQRGNASWPGENGWPRTHYRISVVQADGLYQLENDFRSGGNGGDAGDFHEPRDFPLDINMLLNNKVKHMEAHEVLSSYKRFEDFAIEDKEVRDVRSLSLKQSESAIQASLIVNDGYGTNSISIERSDELKQKYISKDQLRKDDICHSSLIRVFEDPLLQQQCISKQLNPAVAGCLIDCLETINPSIKDQCVRAEGVICDYTMPKPTPPSIVCGDYVEAWEDSPWTDMKCKSQCMYFTRPENDNYCKKILKSALGGDIASVNEDPWVASKCMITRMERDFPEISVCRLIEECETSKDGECPVKKLSQ